MVEAAIGLAVAKSPGVKSNGFAGVVGIVVVAAARKEPAIWSFCCARS